MGGPGCPGLLLAATPPGSLSPSSAENSVSGTATSYILSAALGVLGGQGHACSPSTHLPVGTSVCKDRS